MISIRRAVAADERIVRDLLSEAELPIDDLDGGNVELFVAESGGEVVGTIGLERYPPAGLLRSAAVTPAARGRGIGVALVEAIVAEARSGRLSELVLLTTTAEGFFSKMGFVKAARESMSGELLASSQFTGTRCASAAVMRLPLR